MQHASAPQVSHQPPMTAGLPMAARDLRRGDMVYDPIGASQGNAWQLVRHVAVRNDGSVQASFAASEKRMAGGVAVRVLRVH